VDLSIKRDRRDLPPRREPYWQRLGEGAYLGFRRGPDTWIARRRRRYEKGQDYHPLGEAIDYDEAKKRAEAWFASVGNTAVRSAKRGTVRGALDAYLAHLREHGREASATDAKWRFDLLFRDDPLADVKLESATRDDFREWRERKRAGRLPRTLNRHFRSVVAGLNVAVKELGYVGNREAWQLTPLADDRDDDGETAVFLTPEQRKALISACEPATGAYLRGLELTGARPKELAQATVADLDAAHGTLTLRHRKGRPPKLRTRVVVLGADALPFFRQQARRKLPAAPLFPDSAGQPLRRHIWSIETRAGIVQVNKKARGAKRIPPGASAYSFRHARISELLQVHGIDPLTVAQQTGTSLAMIEKAYFKFIASAMREKLAEIREART
jgi:integrase